MRSFDTRSMEGRYTSFNQNYKSKKADKIFKTIPEELNVKGNTCDIIEIYVE